MNLSRLHNSHFKKISIALALALFTLSSCSIEGNKNLSREGNNSLTTVESTQLRPLLNSERIKEKFGSYGIEVLESGAEIRVSNLYSIQGKRKTTRTIAVVTYPKLVAPLFAKEHQEILRGESIGAVFKRNGWKIEKHHQYFGEIDASEELSGLYQFFGRIMPTQLAVHIYSLVIEKDGSKFDYATIAEIHHPQYLSLEELKEIYPRDFKKHQMASLSVRQYLEVVDKKIKNLEENKQK
ncbi:MAG: hypothetical protein QNJ38_16715 [Prochloraceae cyanobacterium]|nr:hypothetical protein [Prochloraceae cyanobacterium]